ncbi:MAG: Zn-dependent alcohol dehydrogenase [Alphaproteobacteria bacterium]|nr:Zn-dependent alcohol dehydrogenase [Alphaproteobacteria bacterium]
MRVTAALMRKVGEPLRIETVELDDPGPREVLVRTSAAGVCHSDLHFVEGLYPTKLPIVLGHESAGVVAKVGRDVRYVAAGDHVITCLSVFCGSCEYCLSGKPSLCTRTGLNREPGQKPRISQNGAEVQQFANLSSYADHMLIHENGLVKIRKDMPLDRAALIGCGVTTGVGAVHRTAKVEPGSSVAVIGCGGIGLSCINGAAIAGAGQIIAIDTVGSKLNLAKLFGATHVIDATKGDVVKQVREITDQGVDYAFEAIGLKKTAEDAFRMLRPGGAATVIGMIPVGVNIELHGPEFLREKKIQGSNMGSNRFRIDMPRYVEFYLAGKLKLDEMISQRIKLEQINEAFATMKTGEVARSVIMF